jgi:hypothetical protein
LQSIASRFAFFERNFMKEKLWTAWGVMGATSLISLIIGNIIFAFIFAFISAIFGWCAFFVDE